MSVQGNLKNLKPSSVLITGANRGIGLALVKAFVKLPTPPSVIFAACRNPASAKELDTVIQHNKFVKKLKCDVSDFTSFPAVVGEVKSIVGDRGLSLLVNNAGILKYEGFSDVSAESLKEHLHVNSVAPTILSQAFTPLLKEAAHSTMSANSGCILNISSGWGSITTASSSNPFAYRMSKCALNMATKLMAEELRSSQVLVLCMCPGWVSTDMGGASATTTPEQSADYLLHVLAGANNNHTGCFFNKDGSKHDW